MPRPPVKKTEKLSEAAEIGVLRAHEKMRKKHLKITIISIVESAREHIGKLIDRIDFKDIVDIVAAIGLSQIVYTALQDIEGVVQIVQGFLNNPTGLIGTALNTVWAIGQQLMGPVQSRIPERVVGGIGTTAPPASTSSTSTPSTSTPGSTFDIKMYLLAFGIAWCIVKFGDKLLNLTVPGIEGILGLAGFVASA